MKPGIDSSLRQKYLDTDYIISDDPPLLMKVGEQSDDLRVLLGSMGVESAAFITAWNPHSEKLTDDENDDRQAVLLTDIEKMRLNYWSGTAKARIGKSIVISCSESTKTRQPRWQRALSRTPMSGSDPLEFLN